MSISEDLQTRLSGLTQGPNPAPRRISNREMELMRETNPMAGRMGSPGQGFYSDTSRFCCWSIWDRWRINYCTNFILYFWFDRN